MAQSWLNFVPIERLQQLIEPEPSIFPQIQLIPRNLGGHSGHLRKKPWGACTIHIVSLLFLPKYRQNALDLPDKGPIAHKKGSRTGAKC